MSDSKFITYEQPVNELIRACLRVEHLFKQIEYHLPQSEVWNTRIALESLLEIITIIDRPDLKTMLVKEFIRYMGTFSRLENLPEIDNKILRDFLNKIESTIERLNSITGRFGQELREIEFLTTIRHHLTNPGGACNFENPAYLYWLEQPLALRQSTLKEWLKTVEFMQYVTALLLQIIRESCIGETKTTTNGLFHMTLDPKSSCQLIRIALPASNKVFPIISAGANRISVTFYNATLIEKAQPVQTDTTFKLTCCVI